MKVVTDSLVVGMLGLIIGGGGGSGNKREAHLKVSMGLRAPASGTIAAAG